MNKKILSCVFFAILSVVLLVQPVAASTTDAAAYNQRVVEQVTQLQDKYNISITYPTRNDGYAAIGTVTLNMLDQTLDYLTPQLVRQLSSFFHDQTGQKISVSFIYPPQGFETEQGIQLASFTSDLARLQIYIPQFDGQMTISGNSPVAIIHEFGHAFQDFVEYKHGTSNLKNQWFSYNDGYSYEWGRMQNPSSTTFVSSYASNDYYEDFAETFACAFTANRDGLGLSGQLVTNGYRTSLGKKVAMIEALLPLYMTDTAKALENIKKVYSAKTYTSFNGVSMSGNALEYIGFPEPNGIRKGVLNAMGIQAASCDWHTEIGGWYVVSTTSETYIAFPGAQFQRFPALKKAA